MGERIRLAIKIGFHMDELIRISTEDFSELPNDVVGIPAYFTVGPPIRLWPEKSDEVELFELRKVAKAKVL